MNNWKKRLAAMVLVLTLVLGASVGVNAAAGTRIQLKNRTPEIWTTITTRLETVQAGGEVREYIGNVTYIPLDILDLLSTKEDVTLALVLGDARVMYIPSAEVPEKEADQKHWLVTDLKALFPPKSTARKWPLVPREPLS